MPTFLPPEPHETGLIPMEELASMPGLEVFQKAMAGELPLPRIAGTVPMRLHEVALGRIVWETRPHEGLLNPMGAVHGGYAMTVLDSAVGCAVHSTLPAGRAYTTLEMKANLTRAIRPDQGPFYATGEVIQSGQRVATAEGRLTDIDGKVYAFATTTCLVFDAG